MQTSTLVDIAATVFSRTHGDRNDAIKTMAGSARMYTEKRPAICCPVAQSDMDGVSQSVLACNAPAKHPYLKEEATLSCCFFIRTSLEDGVDKPHEHAEKQDADTDPRPRVVDV